MRTLFCFLVLACIVLFSACKSNDYMNFTTYFNTFYNEERLMKECEEEFDFQFEKRRTLPRILVPMPINPVLNSTAGAKPTFLQGLTVDKSVRQAVEVKLDSILIKGSKILAQSSKSNYVSPSLYLMAKAYFYKEEWLPSQIKCTELIDKEPTGEYSADAHLLLATNLLMQGKYEAGLTMLSRTVDVAWLNNRYDILTQAFNIEAEMALYYGDYENAIRPYFQAIAQSDDNKQKALWQNDMASILFRLRRYDKAEKAFAKVLDFSPDLTTEYEAKLYRASCLIRLEQYEEANKILYRLDNDGKFEEYKDYVMVQYLVQALYSGNEEQAKQLEFHADSLFATSQALNAYSFEKGLTEFEKGNFIDARSYMAKARASRTPSISQPANKIFIFMSQREISMRDITDKYASLKNAEQPGGAPPPDTATSLPVISDEIKDTITLQNLDTASTALKNSEVDTSENVINTAPPDAQLDYMKIGISSSYYDLARNHYSIGNIDSANYYYKLAAEAAPLTHEFSSRYLYVYAESIRDTNAWKADSILNVIVKTQPKSEYGKVALKRLGYTEAFIMDTVADLYRTGYDLMKHDEYQLAQDRLFSVYEKYPANMEYAPKALYVLGFMYENKLEDFDNAAYYYDILLADYPNSEYAKELSLSMQYKTLVDSDEKIPAELQTREVAIYTADTSILSAPYDTTLLAKPPSKDGFSFDDLKNPSKLLEKAKSKINEKWNSAKEAISNPDDLLEKARGAVEKNIEEGLKMPKPEDFMPEKISEEEPESPDIPLPLEEEEELEEEEIIEE